MTQAFAMVVQRSVDGGCWIATCPDLPNIDPGRAQTAAAAVEALEAAIDRAAGEGHDLPSPAPEIFAVSVAATVGSLREFRALWDMSQTQFAGEVKIDRPILSRAERAGDHRLNFLKRLIAKLDGKLEILANFEGKGLAVKLDF